jgi:23S rRNA pseudouridine1911/1915/1917 synthase
MHHIIDANNVGQRLDKFVTGLYPAFSRTLLQDLISDRGVTVNGQHKPPHYALREGDAVEIVREPAHREVKVEPRTDIRLPIVFEDEAIIVVNKPSGLIVHPATAADTESVAHAMLGHFPALKSVGDSPLRPGIVHRLDKEASGLLVIAKTQAAFDALKAQFQEHSITKEYLVLVDRGPDNDEGTITFAIGRKSGSGRMAARPKGEEGENDREAVTHYKVEERFDHATLMRVRTETGRMHQIRVHMRALGCPIVGDELYGSEKLSKVTGSRLFLHAAKLGFTHPVTGQAVEFTAMLPDELQEVLVRL